MMNILEIVKRAFGSKTKPNGIEVAAELETPDDEETKSLIELDADAAEALLRETADEQHASVQKFSTETIDLRGRFLAVTKSEGSDNGRVYPAG